MSGRDVVLVTGASGIVGSGIVASFLRDGATVIAPIRRPESRESLIQELATCLQGDLDGTLSRLETPVLDIDSIDDRVKLAEFIRMHATDGFIDHVVSCYGGAFRPGPLSELSVDNFKSALDRCVPHVLLFQTVLPVLRLSSEKSSYTIVTGRMGQSGSKTFAGLAIANSALYGIVKCIQKECEEHPLRVNEFRIAALVSRESDPESHPFIKNAKSSIRAQHVGAILLQRLQEQRGKNSLWIMLSDGQVVAE